YFGVVQGRPAQHGSEEQGENASPGNQIESVDISEGVGLEAKLAADDAGSATGGGAQPGGLRGQRGSQPMKIRIGDPGTALHVQAEQVGVKLFAVGDEMSDQHGADLAAEEAHGMEKGREGENPR